MVLRVFPGQSFFMRGDVTSFSELLCLCFCNPAAACNFLLVGWLVEREAAQKFLRWIARVVDGVDVSVVWIKWCQDEQRPHWLRLWRVPSSSTLASAGMFWHVADRNGGGSMLRWFENVRVCCHFPRWRFCARVTHKFEVGFGSLMQVGCIGVLGQRIAHFAWFLRRRA